MTKYFKTAVIASCVASALFTISLPAQAADKQDVIGLFEQIKLDYEIFTLPNGLTTLVYPDKKLPDVFVSVYYRVGSKDEPKGQTGFAHFYEHLMFQGTENSPAEFVFDVNGLGGTGMNGTTSPERTNFFQTVPKGSLDRMLWLEGDRMANLASTVTKQNLEEQRGVVKNEKRQREIGPGSEANEVFFEHFYPDDHPYGHSTIGSMEDIDSVTLEDVASWGKKFYTAKNAVLVLAGNITVSEAKEKVAKYFSDVPAGQRMSEMTEYIPEFQQNKKMTVYSVSSPRTEVTRHWHIPSNSSKEAYLLGHLAPALAGDPNSPLTKRLVDELNYVDSISATTSGGNISGSFSISYTLLDDTGVTREQVDAIIDEELAELFKKGPDMDILEREMLNIDASVIRATSNSQRMASLLAEYYLYHGDAEYWKKARKWQIESDKKELKQVAKKWLSKPYFELAQLPEPVGNNMSVAVDRTRVPEITKSLSKLEFPEFKQTTLENGMQVFLIEDQTAPVVDLTFEFGASPLTKDGYTAGTAGRMFNHMRNGTEDLSESELREKIDEIAMKLRGFSPLGLTTTTNINLLTPYLDDGLEIFSDIVMNPAFPEDKFAEERQNVDLWHDQQQADPNRAAQSLFGKLLWGEEHEFGETHDREFDRKNISREDVIRFHKKEIGPNNTRVWVHGNVSLQDISKKLSRHFDDWEQVSPTKQAKIEKAKSMAGKVVLIDVPGAPSTSISMGQIVPEYQKTTAGLLQVFNTILGGQFESRLNLNLRESKGWTYGIGSTLNPSAIAEQVFSVGTQVQSDKTAASAAEILKEFTGMLTNKPVTEEEFEKFRNNALQTYPANFKNNSSYIQAAMNSDAFGEPLDYSEGFAERINSMTLEQVNSLAKETFSPDKLVWMFVGDVASFEQQIRDLNLGEVEIWDSSGNKVR